MGRTTKWIVSVMGILGLTLMAMQNCSEVEFAAVEEAELRKISDENAFVVGAQPVSLDETYESGDESGGDEGMTPNESSPNMPEEVEGGTSADTTPEDGGANTPESNSPQIIENEASTTGSEETVMACGQLEVRDIIIDILGIEVNVGGGEKFQLNIGSGPADLLDLARGIDFVPDRNMSIQQMRVLLGEENYVITANNLTYPLKAQSQQNAGLLVKLGGRKDLIKDVTYHLTMVFEPEFMVKAGGKECTLHPNVTATID